MSEAIKPGESLAGQVHAFKRGLIAATIEEAPTMAEAARRLGITREGLYRLRKRYGLEIPTQTIGIPADWRERLEAAS